MNKIKINVPDGIRFLSDWNDFNFKNFPSKCIINKQIPGCGFTEWCIRVNSHVVLTSPRKHLLRNKAGQHEGEVFLVVNEMEPDVDIDKDLTKDKKEFNDGRFETPEEKAEKEKNLIEGNKKAYDRIHDELIDYYNECRASGKFMKILVTYDSYRIVREVLIEVGIFNQVRTIVDEFQSILHDSRFKSSTELQFMQALDLSPTSYFVSATPMMEEYLDMLDEFKDLPYYELDWEKENPARVTIPDLDVKAMRSVTEEMTRVIKEFLDGKYESKFVIRDDKPVEVVSNKIVLYVNSVKHIISVVKRLKLKPEQINIICSVTEENKKKLKKGLGKNYTIGKVPLKKDPEPDITFCTRTVYLGADFYSKCARSYIFSDANIDSLAVDISEDLPQILGRQRLDENPWKNHAYFFYRSTANYRGMGKDYFDKELEKKMKKTKDLLAIFDGLTDYSQMDTLADSYRLLAEIRNYKDNYVAVNRKIGENGNVELYPLLNKLVLANEMRAFKIQQIDYKDRFTVFATVNKKITPTNTVATEASKFMNEYKKLTTVKDRLKFICESQVSKEVLEVFLNQLSDSDDVKSYYLLLGKEKLKSYGYGISMIKKNINIITFNPLVLENIIYQDFNEGDRISLSEIKDRLSKIYESIGYRKSPKAVDLNEFFELKKCKISTTDDSGNNKRVEGYELLKKKR